MAISDSKKVDFLWKKILYGVSNTNISGKAGYEEIYSSEVPTYANDIWAQSNEIQKPAPNATTGVHQYYGISNAIECTPDPTVAGNKTWLATGTYGDTNTRLEDWIPPTIDPTYLIQVYKGDPNNGGTALNQGTEGYEWIFDYVTGVLSFVNSVPSGVDDTISSNRIWIVGHRYVGTKGLTGAGGAAASTVVATIAERDALSPSEGDICHVEDASGDTANAQHIGSGEYANYIYTSAGWKLLSTQDSVEADSGTASYSITNASTSDTIVTVRAGSRAVRITVDVDTAFDGTPTLSIGDAGNTSRLMTDDEIDLNSLGTYVADASYLYSTDTAITFTFNAGGATVGNATITVNWVS